MLLIIIMFMLLIVGFNWLENDILLFRRKQNFKDTKLNKCVKCIFVLYVGLFGCMHIDKFKINFFVRILKVYLQKQRLCKILQTDCCYVSELCFLKCLQIEKQPKLRLHHCN